MCLIKKLIPILVLLPSYAIANNSLAESIKNDIYIRGYVDAKWYYRTNNTYVGSDSTNPNNTYSAQPGQEVDIIINIGGKHQTDFGPSVIWNLGSEVKTNTRYDFPGGKEAWVGLDGRYGRIMIGNQMSNLYSYVFDNIFASKGMHYAEDYGAFSVNYTQSVNYQTPVIYDFQLMLQHSIPHGVTVNSEYGAVAGEATYQDTAFSYAREALLTYSKTLSEKSSVNLNFAYVVSKNNLYLTTGTTQFNGLENGNWGTPYGNNKFAGVANSTENYENSASNITVAGNISYGDLYLYLMYQLNTWQGNSSYGNMNTCLNLNNDCASWSNNNLMARITWMVNKRNAISVGYEVITSFESTNSLQDSITKDTGASLTGFQYDYFLSDNSRLYFQARTTRLESANAYSYMNAATDDGMADPLKPNTRYLLGIWYSFN